MAYFGVVTLVRAELSAWERNSSINTVTNILVIIIRPEIWRVNGFCSYLSERRKGVKVPDVASLRRVRALTDDHEKGF